MDSFLTPRQPLPVNKDPLNLKPKHLTKKPEKAKNAGFLTR